MERNTHTKLLWLTYIMHILIVFAPIALIINFLKVREYKRLLTQSDHQQAEALEFAYSHHHWLMVSFISTLIFGMIGVGTAYFAVGFVIGAVVLLWWAYRMARGVIMLVEGKTLPMLENWHEESAA